MVVEHLHQFTFRHGVRHGTQVLCREAFLQELAPTEAVAHEHGHQTHGERGGGEEDLLEVMGPGPRVTEALEQHDRELAHTGEREGGEQ